jgi:hypothetical protein
MAPLLHPVSENTRPQPIFFSQEYLHRSLAEDREIVERVIAAYHQAASTADPATRRSMFGTIWGENGVIGKQGPLIQALQEKSAAGVHDILRQYFITDAAFGIALGKREVEVVSQQPDHRRHYGLMWLDRLVGLAEAIGALSIPNPEDSADRRDRSLEVDPDQVFAAVENAIGQRLSFPDICAIFGGEIRGRAFPFISFTHLLVALHVRSLALRADPTVFEIGGGFGGLAYFACQLMGCDYTIFDLAWANAVQAYFLHRALPGRRLVLCGEPAGPGGGIALMPAWLLFQQPAGTHVDVVVNQDSMPEMPQLTACRYLEVMRAILRGPFLSVNQEPPPHSSQTWDRTSVAQLVGRVGGYERFSRSPFFLRMGYVQEVYYSVQAGYNPHTRYDPAHAGQKPARHPIRTAYRLMKQGDFRGLKDRFRHRVGGLFRSAP